MQQVFWLALLLLVSKGFFYSVYKLSRIQATPFVSRLKTPYEGA